jgi:DHA2 family multidrug resistance protein
MRARGGQIHQANLVSNLTPFDSNYQIAAHKMAQAMHYKGFVSAITETAGNATIYHGLLRQASMLSFNRAFFVLSVMMILILPLVFLMRRGKSETIGFSR